MAAAYILYSKKANRYYTGSCNDLQLRLSQHRNKTFSIAYTLIADDWELFFHIDNLDGTVARKIEAKIKSMKSRKYIENLKKYPEMTSNLIVQIS
jgi:putative endonuclease